MQSVAIVSVAIITMMVMVMVMQCVCHQKADEWCAGGARAGGSAGEGRGRALAGALQRQQGRCLQRPCPQEG